MIVQHVHQDKQVQPEVLVVQVVQQAHIYHQAEQVVNHVQPENIVQEEQIKQIVQPEHIEQVQEESRQVIVRHVQQVQRVQQGQQVVRHV